MVLELGFVEGETVVVVGLADIQANFAWGGLAFLGAGLGATEDEFDSESELSAEG